MSNDLCVVIGRQGKKINKFLASHGSFYTLRWALNRNILIYVSNNNTYTFSLRRVVSLTIVYLKGTVCDRASKCNNYWGKKWSSLKNNWTTIIWNHTERLLLLKVRTTCTVNLSCRFGTFLIFQTTSTTYATNL